MLMLQNPNIESPANIDASVEYRDNREEYNKKVRKLTQRSMDDIWAALEALSSAKIQIKSSTNYLTHK